MARLVAVFHDEETRLEERQIPLLVDDALAMVLQFDNPCSLCEGNAVSSSTSGNASSTSLGSCGGSVGVSKGLQRFVQRFEKLSSSEKESALTVEGKEVFQNLAQMFPCVGCRRSVERMFNDVKDYEHNALHPLFVNASYKLTLSNDYKLDPKLIYSLFYVHGSKVCLEDHLFCKQLSPIQIIQSIDRAVFLILCTPKTRGLLKPLN